MIQAGQYITDGTAVFLVCDIRDGAMVGDIILRETLRKGYVKANGAQVVASDYPRLVAYAVDNGLTVADDTAWAADKSKYVYDDVNDTLRLPEATGRVLQGGTGVASVEAGLPNITGTATPNLMINGTFNNALPAEMINASGALGSQGHTGNSTWVNAGGTATATFNKTLTLDASRSSAIYGNSDTVQPPALTMIPQIKY